MTESTYELFGVHWDKDASVFVATCPITGCVSQGLSRWEACEAAISAGKLFVEAILEDRGEVHGE